MASIPKGTIRLNIAPSVPNFQKQFVFNTFSIENEKFGSVLRLGYLYEGIHLETVSLLVSTEGLAQVREGSTEYIESFGQVPQRRHTPIPHGNSAPLFVNYVRLAMAGMSGEIACYTVLLQDIGTFARSKSSATANNPVNLVQVGLFHSDLVLHKQAVLGLIGSI